MRYVVIPLMVLFAPVCWSNEPLSQEQCPGKYGARLVSLQGKVFFDADGSGQWQPARLNELLCEGSRVKVQPYSRASLMLANGIVLRLDQGTVLSLNGIAPQQPTALDLIRGFIHFISRTPRQLKISSPIANAGPEGTEFAMQVEANKASLWVYEGQVRFFNPQGELKLSPGQGAEALSGQTPRAQIAIKPADAVNWALYYPPILPYPRPSAVIDANIRVAIDEFRRGRTDDALFQLDAVAPEKRSAYYFKVRSAIRLTAGRVTDALQDIRQLLAENPNDAEALALEAVVALTQNRKDEALDLAHRAITADPDSATAYSALSYAEQGRFDLDQALAAAERAAGLAPHDAMVWARKAELDMAKGLSSNSEQAAKRALALDPTLERTQTVVGFSYLMRMEADAARETFEQAVKFDSTSPLARLGLGLAKIRDGDLEEGRRDLEIAAILDPDNSLVRSYLGKAYYEERRSRLAEDQFNLAKERDPKDPTPYFYDAINKQTTNRPVEALRDMQKAIELNDNRGVYRSKLALDKDLAARSSAQGRIYNDLGFPRLGLLEGWKSATLEPGNYSAHRLLADNYASQPSHEIARVSELLQSQLLQPLNITPIQPQLAQSNLLIVDGLGPSSLAFNEFNPLFTRNRFSLQASGVVGGNNTWGEDIIHSGLWDSVSYSLGQFHYETNGFRDNNFLDQNIYNAFVQGNINESLNLQAEYRREERENGDLSLNFDSTDFSSNFKENRIIDTYRIGGRYIHSPHSSIIGSIIYQDVDISQTSSNLFTFFNPIIENFDQINIFKGSKIKRLGFISELQNQYINDIFNLISGVGYIGQSVDRSDLNFDSGKPLTPNNEDIYKYNFYSYLTLNKKNKINTIIGASYDDLDINNLIELRSFNPKLGFIWKISPFTTLRAAGFRVMNFTRTSNQTIEPTQIAGFNQFFDDPNGTRAWRFGAAIDHKILKNLFSGIEYSERILDVPIGKTTVDWSEQRGRAYLYYSLFDQISLSAEYFYERFNRSKNPAQQGIANLINHRIPLTINVFHPSGFSFMLRTSYVNQKGIFEKSDIVNNTSQYDGKSDFFLFDVDLNYRLPSRFGIISLGIKNLFDNRFNYQSNNSFLGSNSFEVPYYPERLLFGKVKFTY